MPFDSIDGPWTPSESPFSRARRIQQDLETFRTSSVATAALWSRKQGGPSDSIPSSKSAASLLPFSLPSKEITTQDWAGLVQTAMGKDSKGYRNRLSRWILTTKDIHARLPYRLCALRPFGTKNLSMRQTSYSARMLNTLSNCKTSAVVLLNNYNQTTCIEWVVSTI